MRCENIYTIIFDYIGTLIRINHSAMFNNSECVKNAVQELLEVVAAFPGKAVLALLVSGSNLTKVLYLITF